MAKEVVLVRHGSTGPEHQNRYVGRLDLHLAEEGEQQADALARALSRRQRPCELWTSPLIRALETAQAIQKVHPLRAAMDADLREVDFGRWEGFSFDQMKSSDPDLVDQWACLDPAFAFPGGESLQSFRDRVVAVADRLSGSGAEQVLVVTHAGIIRSLICHFLGLDFKNYVLFDTSPASITTLRLYNSKGVLSELNNCSHLKGA